MSVGDIDLGSDVSLGWSSDHHRDVVDDFYPSDDNSLPDPTLSHPWPVETSCIPPTLPLPVQAGPSSFTTTFVPSSAARLASNHAVYGSGASEAEILTLCPAHLRLRRNAGQFPVWATRNPRNMRRYEALVGGPRPPDLLRAPQSSSRSSNPAGPSRGPHSGMPWLCCLFAARL